MKLLRWIKIVAFVFVLNTLYLSTAVAQSTCVTPYLSCIIPQNAPAGYACFCNTPRGPMRGIIGAPQVQQPFPMFCCTPSGKYGPFQNNSIPVGGSCYTNTQFGVVYGQACY